MAAVTTNNKKTEVTKLLTVTLGKIHESKRNKFGLNLRKSLLVQSVLHKAKDVYAAEVKSRHRLPESYSTNDCEMDTNCSNTATISEPSPAKVRRFVSQSSIVESKSELEESSSEESQIDDDNLNDDDDDDDETNFVAVRPSALPFSRFTSKPCTPAESLVDNILEELATDSENDTTSAVVDKENNPPTTKTSQSRLKRKLSMQDCDGDENLNSNDSFSNHNDNNTYVPKKRLRVNSVDHSDSKTDTSTTIIMDTTPINSLVKIFSQSFLELTPTDISEHGSIYEKSTELNTFALCRDSIALTA